MAVRLTEDGSYFYVFEPDLGHHAEERARLSTADSRVVTRRKHGYAARVEVLDESGLDLPLATSLRAASAFGRALERLGDALSRPLRVRLAGDESNEGWTIDSDGIECATVRASFVAEAPIHHPVDALALELLSRVPWHETRLPVPPLAGAKARRVLFFESLMNSDLPHNDCELSQGVLHMASSLLASGVDVAFANVKMAIVGAERPVVGLAEIESALEHGPIDLVCITLLEGYFEGVLGLIAELRRLGCRAHVAVGGVMPTLTPEHVAAHMPDVSFVCRGAGEAFLPRLAEILGPNSSIDEPLDRGQRLALLQLDGLLVVDRAGRRLIGANPARTVSVESLDRVQLDLGLLQARHLEQGVEVSTSRGCVHKCSFCSIIGRQSYQARSAAGVFELLERYEERYRELFGNEIPNNAHRLHISDDDFACDRDRAREFFQRLLGTPFRLSSVQVSIADLCKRNGKQLLPEPDHELLDAIRPECFADFGAKIPERDFVVDHKSRRWSAYLQIGVETFSERELDRLGKGYGRAHVRVIVSELARRQIHMDAYLILANADTTAADLVDSVEELCRLKLRHPKWFHVRFPVVPRLVSYFPSASHRRMLRKGQWDALRLRAHLRIPQHPELDYPFVDADEPRDEWVRAADSELFGDERCYTGTLDALRERFRSLVRADEELPRERERLLRRLDDLPRRLVFDMLRDQGHLSSEAPALATATELLGPVESFAPAFRRFASESAARLVVIPTWQCELRCVYCYIPKQDGRVMSRSTLERSIDLLLSTERPKARLQFFGGEALVEWELVRHGIDYGVERAKLLGKDLSFTLSSNGWSLDAEKLAYLRERPVKLELSLDGTSDVQNHARPSRLPMHDSYQNGIGPRAQAIVESGLATDVIMVVLPHHVTRMPEGFFHIAGLGFKRIQINFALGVMWREEHKKAFADGLFQIGHELRRRWARGDTLTMVNLETALYPVRLNGEVTVDWDGTVYSGNGFLHENEHKQKLVMGHLDDHRSFDRYWLDAPGNDFLLQWGYTPKVTANNRAVGAIMTSFVRWMRENRDGPAHTGGRQTARAVVRAEVDDGA
jgi:MoaA/NifB/PqqE/SkfB family radical SAM enzyme